MMLAGSIPLGLSFVLLFNPAGFVLGSQWPLFGWLLMSVILMRTFLTVFIVPHTAMGAEITADYVERTSVVSYRTNLAWIFGVLLPAISLPLLFATVDGQDGRFIVENYQRYGWVSCLLVLVMSFICIVGTRQFIPRLLEVAGRNDSSPGFSGLVRDGLGTLKNMNFRRILILDIAVGATMGIIGALHMVTMTYFWEASALQIALLATASLLAAVLVMPSMNYMANRWQKQTYLKVALVDDKST
jgi:Na+/melibiose symporter-like transporter